MFGSTRFRFFANMQVTAIRNLYPLIISEKTPMTISRLKIKPTKLIPFFCHLQNLAKHQKMFNIVSLAAFSSKICDFLAKRMKSLRSCNKKTVVRSTSPRSRHIPILVSHRRCKSGTLLLVFYRNTLWICRGPRERQTNTTRRLYADVSQYSKLPVLRNAMWNWKKERKRWESSWYTWIHFKATNIHEHSTARNITRLWGLKGGMLMYFRAMNERDGFGLGHRPVT